MYATTTPRPRAMTRDGFLNRSARHPSPARRIATPRAIGARVIRDRPRGIRDRARDARVRGGGDDRE